MTGAIRLRAKSLGVSVCSAQLAMMDGSCLEQWSSNYHRNQKKPNKGQFFTTETT